MQIEEVAGHSKLNGYVEGQSSFDEKEMKNVLKNDELVVAVSQAGERPVGSAKIG